MYNILEKDVVRTPAADGGRLSCRKGRMRNARGFRVLQLALAAALAWTAGAAQTPVPSTAYVQRGLLCHFDARDNAGRNAHSSTATTWVDLTGNGNDATVHFSDAKGTALKGYWASCALCSTGKTDGVYADFHPAESLRTVLNAAGPWTLEMVDTMDNANQDTSGCLEFGVKEVFGKTHKGSDFRGFFYIAGNGSGFMDVNGATQKFTFPRTVVYVHDGTKITRYRNNVADAYGTVTAPTPGSKPLTADSLVYLLYHFVGDMFAVRVYDRALTENERKYNAEIDRDRFFFRCAQGLSTVETAEATALKVKVTATCPSDAGTVAIDGETAGTSVVKTVDFGASVTIAFTPADGQAAHGWANVPFGTDTSGATVTFTADRAVNAHVLTAARTVHYVSTTGDNADDGTQAHPWRGIEHAVCNSAVKEFDEIRIQGGLYEESVMLSTVASESVNKQRLTLLGSYDASWSRDLASSRTVIKPVARASVALQVYNAASNVVDGVDLTGARVGYGFCDSYTVSYAENGARNLSLSTFLRHCIVTNNYMHGTGAFGCWGSGDQPRAGIRCASCFIADNGGWGYGGCGSTGTDNQGASRLFTNCTLVRNASGGIYPAIAYGRGATTCRNCIIAENGGPQVKGSESTYIGYVTFYNSIIWRGDGGVAFNSTDFGYSGSGSKPAIPTAFDLFACAPLLGADGKPLAASHANKAGCDVDAVSGAPVAEDVYGNAWAKGAYDVGCFKTAHALPATRRSLDDVYVAADGSDAAAGTSADAAVATLDEAFWRVKERGVVHVGAGTFTNGIPVLSTEGVRLEGAGPEATVIAAPGYAKAAQAALQVAASNVVLVGCAFTNGVYGVLCANPSVCGKGFWATNCCFVGNRVGYRQCGYAYEMNRDGWIQWLSRCRFEANTHDGLWLNARCCAESSLFARNGRYGMQVNGHDANGTCMLMNCTLADNKSYGLYKCAGNNGPVEMRNCIVANHANGVFPGGGNCGSSVKWQQTLFDNATNQVYNAKAECTLNGMTDSCITNQPAGFRGGADARRVYRLASRSAARGAGSWALYPWEKATPAHDLEGRPWDRRLDLGCHRRSPPPMRLVVK